MKLFWTREALNRLQDIYNYISQDNPDIAAEFIDNVISAAESIKDNPGKGRVVPELSIKKIRELLFKNYRIVYYLKQSTIEILTVFEGHQLLKKDEIRKNISINSSGK